ncbi:MAG: DUF1428 family protein [Nitrososphaeraceae archaeon]
MSRRRFEGNDGNPIPKLIKINLKRQLSSWMTYKSRSHRNSVNSKVLKDRRMKNMDPKSMPFDPNRLVYVGFQILVSET